MNGNNFGTKKLFTKSTFTMEFARYFKLKKLLN